MKVTLSRRATRLPASSLITFQFEELVDSLSDIKVFSYENTLMFKTFSLTLRGGVLYIESEVCSIDSLNIYYTILWQCKAQISSYERLYGYLSSHGLAVKAYGFEVSAPTGHKSKNVI